MLFSCDEVAIMSWPDFNKTTLFRYMYVLHHHPCETTASKPKIAPIVNSFLIYVMHIQI